VILSKYRRNLNGSFITVLETSRTEMMIVLAKTIIGFDKKRKVPIKIS
jgi:hypothetical protein